MLKKLGLAALLLGSAGMALVPSTAYAQDGYYRGYGGYGSYSDRRDGDWDRHERREWREHEWREEQARRSREWREHEWREHENRERYGYGNGYYAPYGPPPPTFYFGYRQ